MVKHFYGLTGTKLQIAIAVVAGTDFALFGYDQGVMGGLLTLPSFLNIFPQVNTSGPNPSLASNIQGITVGSYTLGCFFGAVATIWLGNLLGRKRTIMVGSSIMVVGAAIQCSSSSLGQLIAGRLITGFGNGQMVMIEGSLIVFGVMLSYWIDLGFSFLEPSTIAWRFPIAFQILLALFILCAIPGLPESPRWLILKGKDEEALQVLAALSGFPEDDKRVKNEFRQVQDAVFEMSQGTFADCFKLNRNRNFHRTVLAYVNQMFQQISAINIITYYLSTVLHDQVGLDGFLSRLLAACNGTEYFLASIIAIFTIEKFGRRNLMLFGATGQACTMAILAGVSSQSGSGFGIATVVFLFVFNTFFAIGWLGMTWLYPAEITPLSIRAPATAISTTANWIFNFMVVMVTPVAFNSIGYKTYIVFGCINAFMVPCVYWFFPETSGRSLEEMDEIFRKVSGFKGAFDVVKVARDLPRRYGKDGELLIAYEETDEARNIAERRQSSVAAGAGGGKSEGPSYQEKV